MGAIKDDNIQVTLVMAKALLKRVDAIADRQGMSRSALMARMIDSSISYEEEIVRVLDEQRRGREGLSKRKGK